MAKKKGKATKLDNAGRKNSLITLRSKTLWLY